MNKTDVLPAVVPSSSKILNVMRKPSRPSLQHKRKSIPTRIMVTKAIKSQMSNARRGVSLAAIKKYICQHYQTGEIDLNNRMRYIKNYIVRALDDGKLLRTKGTNGATGSFRLPNMTTEPKARKPIKKVAKKNPKKATKNTVKVKVIKAQVRSKLKTAAARVNLKKLTIKPKMDQSKK